MTARCADTKLWSVWQTEAQWVQDNEHTGQRSHNQNAAMTRIRFGPPPDWISGNVDFANALVSAAATGDIVKTGITA